MTTTTAVKCIGCLTCGTVRGVAVTLLTAVGVVAPASLQAQALVTTATPSASSWSLSRTAGDKGEVIRAWLTVPAPADTAGADVQVTLVSDRSVRLLFAGTDARCAATLSDTVAWSVDLARRARRRLRRAGLLEVCATILQHPPVRFIAVARYIPTGGSTGVPEERVLASDFIAEEPMLDLSPFGSTLLSLLLGAGLALGSTIATASLERRRARTTHRLALEREIIHIIAPEVQRNITILRRVLLANDEELKTMDARMWLNAGQQLTHEKSTLFAFLTETRQDEWTAAIRSLYEALAHYNNKVLGPYQDEARSSTPTLATRIRAADVRKAAADAEHRLTAVLRAAGEAHPNPQHPPAHA